VSRKNITIALAVVYAIVLFIGLTLWRLPAEKLIPYVAERLSKGRLLLKAERADFSFPLGFNLEKVSYAFGGGVNPSTDRLDRLTVGVNPLGLIRASLGVSFRIYPPGKGATIQGDGSIPIAGKNGSVEFSASGVQLGEMNIFKSLAGRDLKGIATGDAAVSGNFTDLSTWNGRGNLKVQKGSVDTRMDLAGLKAIPFDLVRIPFTIKDGQLSLEKVEIEGPMLSGVLSGRVKLNKVVASSTLDLTARLKFGPLFYQNPLAGAFLPKIKEGSKEIILRIGGSVQRPTLVMEK